MGSNRLFWWLNPASVMLLLHLPLLVVSFALPEWAYSQLWFEPKYFDLYAAALSTMAILAWLGGFLILKKDTATNIEFNSELTQTVALNSRNVRWLFNIALTLTVVGYVAMFGAAFARGLTVDLLIAALQGQQNVMPQLKEIYFATIPGLTTLTQFGPAAAVLGTLLARFDGWRSIRKRTYLIIGLAAIRAFFVSERLALIEIVAPAMILSFRFVRYPVGAKQWLRRKLLTGLPVAAVFCLLVIFGGFEYFRSWTNFYAQKGGDFTTFTTLRALGYYSTAYNNSAFLLYNFHTDSLIPQFTAEWLWRFPGINLLLGDGADVVAERGRGYMSLLRSGVNPEFNNSGGLLMPIVDYGVIGGLLFWFLVGIVTKKLFDAYKACTPAGLLLYPICLLGLLEASRLIYWTSGRVFPSVAMLLVALVMLAREPRAGAGRLDWRPESAL